MNFCPTCEFLLFTKINPETNKLQNHCKNCFWIGDYIRESNSDSDINRICVYKKIYNNDFVSDSIVSNPNIVYDNTLPRINNIKCINKQCISNINKNVSLEISTHYNKDIEKDIIDDTRKQNIKILCGNYLSTQNIKKKKITKVSKDSCIVLFHNKSDRARALQLADTIYDDYTIKINEFSPVNNEIIFIKYNDNALKYMYICAHCKTSWKN